MTVALVDNGSLQPAAHRQLRSLAATLGARTGVTVHAVSWKHTDRVRPSSLAGGPTTSVVPLQPDGRGWTLASWLRAQFAGGERDFVFVPFFVSAQGAIGSALRDDLDALRRELGDFEVEFTPGLAADGTLARVVADRVRQVMADRELTRPAILVVDHGGPSAESARLRDAVAASVQTELGEEIGPLAAASLEGADHAHNRPLFADQLAVPGFDRGVVVVAPLFLAPGRHAGPRGDLAQIARAAEDRLGEPPLRCHFADLVGTHPLTADSLAEKLRATLLIRRARSVSTSRFTSENREPSLPAGFAPGFQPSPLSA